MVVIHVVGNEAGEEFKIQNFDTSGEFIGILVNTSEFYDGIRPMDLLTFQDKASLEITAEGE